MRYSTPETLLKFLSGGLYNGGEFTIIHSSSY
jgi:hypothetical protein